MPDHLGNWVSAVCRWAYRDHEWARVAALAPLVLQAAGAGDAVSLSIILAAAEELAGSVKAAWGKLSKEDSSPPKTIVLAGTHPFVLLGSLVGL